MQSVLSLAAIMRSCYVYEYSALPDYVVLLLIWQQCLKGVPDYALLFIADLAAQPQRGA